jgi:sulfur-oxidizing protein SoxY
MQLVNHHDRRTGAVVAWRLAAIVAGAVMLACLPGPARAQTLQAASSKIWDGLRTEVFGDREVQVGTGAVTIIAPKRAQEAGLVPVDIQIDPAKAGGAITAITLIIDVNPAPVAAAFKLGRDSGLRHLSTRVRVNDYSYVRAIAETASGELHMAETFVKASGGCSASAGKNPDDAKISLGVMKLRQFPPQEGTPASAKRELQLMIRHPNHSGFQMDQITRYFIPPHFVRDVTISQGGAMILKMEGGISISEDPNFRFDFIAKSGGEIVVEAIDTEGLVFRDKWPVDATGL